MLAGNSGGWPSWALAVAWFAALALPAFLFAGASGAHFNPAITLGLSVVGAHPRSELLPYAGAQIAGAFVGSATVLLLLGTGSHLGSTLPAGGNLVRAVLLELPFTALLGASVAAGFRWSARLGRWAPLLPSLVVGVSTFVIGPVTGSSLNIARSLAPAVLSSSYDGLWAYLIAVPIGAVLGVLAVLGVSPRPSPRADVPLTRGSPPP